MRYWGRILADSCAVVVTVCHRLCVAQDLFFLSLFLCVAQDRLIAMFVPQGRTRFEGLFLSPDVSVQVKKYLKI